jgi:hypothetical protein
VLVKKKQKQKNQKKTKNKTNNKTKNKKQKKRSVNNPGDRIGGCAKCIQKK